LGITAFRDIRKGMEHDSLEPEAMKCRKVVILLRRYPLCMPTIVSLTFMAWTRMRSVDRKSHLPMIVMPPGG